MAAWAHPLVALGAPPSPLSSVGLLTPTSTPRGLAPEPVTGWITLLRPLIAQTTRHGSGILTGCPSTTPNGLALGPTNPTRINLPSETLDLRGIRFSRILRYSCQHSHSCSLQPSLQSTFTAEQDAPLLLRRPQSSKPTASVTSLSPVEFSAQDH